MWKCGKVKIVWSSTKKYEEIKEQIKFEECFVSDFFSPLLGLCGGVWEQDAEGNIWT